MDGVEVITRDEAWLKAHSMGGVIGVCQGSANRPVLLEVLYTPEGYEKLTSEAHWDKEAKYYGMKDDGEDDRKEGESKGAVEREREKSIALVGKGVTFDTGGISIKPAANMEIMKGVLYRYCHFTQVQEYYKQYSIFDVVVLHE